MTDHASSTALVRVEQAKLVANRALILYRPPESLKAAPGHARKHPQKQLTRLAASIREFGFTHPVLVTAKNEIICGHARVEAAKMVGLATIPTLCLADLSEAQVRAYRIADNKLAEGSTWDLSLLGEELRIVVGEADDIMCVETLGFDIAEAEILIEGAAGTDKAEPEEEIPEPEAIAVSRPGDLWLPGDHRLYCGSCLDADSWQRVQSEGLAHAAFVDPPYNVSVAGHVSGLGKVRHAEFAMASGEMSSDEFIAFNKGWLELMIANMSDGAVIAACMDWRSSYELESAVRSLGLGRLNLCIFNKTNGGMGSMYRSKYELVHILKVGSAPHINNVQLGRYGRYRTNVWDYAGANSFGKSRMEDLSDHPTVKPVAMVADFLRDISHRGHIVLDPFMGSGTTLLAAERTGRRARGIEIEPAYVDVAIRRWEKLTGKQATLADDGRSFAEVARERLAEASA